MKKYFMIMLLCVVLSILIIIFYDNRFIVSEYTDNETIRVEAPDSTPEIEYSFYEFAIPYQVNIERLKIHEDQVVISPFSAAEALIDPIKTAIEDHIENTEKDVQESIEIISTTKNYTFKSGYIYYDIDLDYELQEYVQDICNEYGIDHKLVLALIGCESSYQIDAVSKTSDYGLMQINKCNFKHIKEQFGELDFLSAKDNILAGVYMLSLVKDYAKNNNELLMCYNLGVNGAKAKWAKGIYSNIYTEKVQKQMDKLEIIK